MRLIPELERFSYLEHGDTESNDSEAKRKYKRIPLAKRNQLLEKIFFENKKIKNVSFKFILIILNIKIDYLKKFFSFFFRLPKN